MKMEFEHDAEGHARRQRQTTRLLAEKVESGEVLNGLERGFVAAILRGAADSIQATTRQGPPSKLPDGDDAAMEYAFLVVHQGKSKTQACSYLAEKYDVSIQAVRKRLSKKRRAERAIDFASNQS